MKKYTFAFTILCTIITTSFGMLTEVSFKPYIQVLNSKVEKQRKNGECLNYINIIKEISGDNDYYRCFQYALQETTGFTGNINFYSSKYCDIPLNEFFQQIPHPTAGCLVVYADSDLKVKHFAVAIDSMNFKSKFGVNSEIFRHGLFQVPERYENHAYFLVLLPKYENNREQLYQDLEKAALRTQQQARHHQTLFFSAFCISSFLTGVAISKAANYAFIQK